MDNVSTGPGKMDITKSITRHWLEERKVEVLSLIGTRHRLEGREVLFLPDTIMDTRHRLEGRKVLVLSCTITDTRHRLGGRKVLFLSCTIIDNRHRLGGRKVLFLSKTNTDTATTKIMVYL